MILLLHDYRKAAFSNFQIVKKLKFNDQNKEEYFFAKKRRFFYSKKKNPKWSRYVIF